MQRAMTTMMINCFFFFPVRAVIAGELEEGRLGSSCHLTESSTECGWRAWTSTSRDFSSHRSGNRLFMLKEV